MSVAVRSARRKAIHLLLLAGVIGAQLPLVMAAAAVEASGPDHLVISEVVTGGASASDEFIEIYNPTASALPLEGLEVIYVSASGATVSRRASWEVGAPEVPAGGHVLVANEGGLFAPIADATYASGMAATGGSVAIRILGATIAIDGVGWGNATGSWLEGTPAPAPGSGSSLERLPGGPVGSWQDTDDNAADVAERDVPEPQNLASVPTPAADAPAAPPVPTPQPPTPAPPAPEPTPMVTPPAPSTTPIAIARGLPDGTSVAVEGVALTASDFHDGGGFVADASGGIAVLVTGAGFSRGDHLRLSGLVDDRFSQRTLRVDGGAVEVLGAGLELEAAAVATGAVGESLEGSLVRVAGTLTSSGSALTTGVAFDFDDGSGATRLVIGTSVGVDTSAWKAGTRVVALGVVGQRDSTGSGTTGYRVMPRDAADVLLVEPPSATQPPAPSPAGASPAASGDPSSSDVVTIADARNAPRNSRLVVRGIVTLPPGVVDADTAVVQDATAAIVLRLGNDAGALRAGQLVEVAGSRSTLSGMETLRVTDPIRQLGSASLPGAATIRSGDAGEENEARLVLVRGALVASARRAASGSASFDIDDGSGPLKVALGASLSADTSLLQSGTWVEVRGVLGQQTTGSKPREGYRLWPASLAAVRIVAPAGDGGDDVDGGGDVEPPGADLGDLGQPDLAELRVGATLVAGPWPELGLGGLLWDGSSLVGIDKASSGLVASAIGGRRPPLAVELGGLSARGSDPGSGLPLVAASAEPGDIVVGSGLRAAPTTKLARTPAWVSVIGRLSQRHGAPALRVRGTLVGLDLRCEGEAIPPRGLVSVTGIALADPLRLVMPCGGVRPVPVLGGSNAIGSSRGARAAIAAAPSEGRSDVRPLAAALLLVAASGLSATALWSRLRGRRGASEADDAAPEPASDPDAVHEPPRLTLVSVPRERGP